jgi:hypothetical protein
VVSQTLFRMVDILTMAQEIELDVRPGEQDVAKALSIKAPAQARPDLERIISIASDGRTRSKFQMVCILTALFVSPPNILLD